MAENTQVKVKKVKDYMRGKLLFVFIFVLLLMSALAVRVIYLNNQNGDRYAKRVLSQQSYVSSTLPYRRGTIYDRNGVILAESTKVYNIILDPKVVLTFDYYRKPTVGALSDIFGFDAEEIEKILDEKKDSSYVVLRKQEGFDTVDAFRKLTASNKFVRGVWFEEEYLRSYPGGSLASHVIGYTNAGNAGSYGIEQYYNDVLNGSDGQEYGYYDSELNMKTVVREPEDGSSIVSTIDYNIQSAVERQVRDFRESVGCKDIGVIVMDPNNGEILAMASNAEYNLNDPRDLSPYYSDEELDIMSDEERMNSLYALWRNFCVSDTFEPGSTFKTVTVASALEEALVSASSAFYCQGFEEIGGWTIHCNNKSGHGNLSLAEALMKSCNCALMEIGSRLGRDYFYDYETNFGYGKKTGIDLVGEASGIIIPRERLNVTELATSSFGTTFNVTMIQMAAAYASIINGGSYYRPHVVREILDNDGALVKSFDNELMRETVSSRTSEFIRQSLYKTVEEGTATPAKVEGYLVGGKTGTAQKKPVEDKKYVVSFVGFAPANDPQLMVYIVMDEIQDEELAGRSTSATSMASRIFSEILPYSGIYPDGDIKYNVNLNLIMDDQAGGTGEGGDGNGADGNGKYVVKYNPANDEGNPDVLPEGLDEALGLGGGQGADDGGEDDDNTDSE